MNDSCNHDDGDRHELGGARVMTVVMVIVAMAMMGGDHGEFEYSQI